LLCARAFSLYRRIEPSPPSLSPCTGPRCPHAMRGYKRDLPCAFYPRPWFHRPPVLEHPITSEHLSEAWPTSPTTRAARHRRCASVSSPPLSPAFLALSWRSRPCQAGSPCTLGTHGEDLVVVRAVATLRACATIVVRYVRSRVPSGCCAQADLTVLWAARRVS
jgi:hypothetical protein